MKTLYIYIKINFYGFHFDSPSYIGYHTFSLHNKPAVYTQSFKNFSEMEATSQYIVLSTVYGQNGYLETIKNKNIQLATSFLKTVQSLIPWVYSLFPRSTAART